MNPQLGGGARWAQAGKAVRIASALRQVRRSSPASRHLVIARDVRKNSSSTIYARRRSRSIERDDQPVGHPINLDRARKQIADSARHPFRLQPMLDELLPGEIPLLTLHASRCGSPYICSYFERSSNAR